MAKQTKRNNKKIIFGSFGLPFGLIMTLGRQHIIFCHFFLSVCVYVCLYITLLIRFLVYQNFSLMTIVLKSHWGRIVHW
jgi:hypothetical protein